MGKLVGVIALACMVVASPAWAKTPCPKVGFTYPWVIDQLMDGDGYAEVYVEIDKSGFPLGCKIGRNNLEKEDIFWVCNAFMQQWRTKPPVELAKGERTTIQRLYAEYGDAHRKAERKAKKEFFKQNPTERPECYPGGD